MNGYEYLRKAIKTNEVMSAIARLPEGSTIRAELLTCVFIVAGDMEAKHDLKKRQAYQLFDAIVGSRDLFCFFRTLRFILMMGGAAEASTEFSEVEESQLLLIDPGFSTIGACYNENVELSIEDLDKETLLLLLRYIETIHVLMEGYIPAIMRKIYQTELVPRVVLFSAIVNGMETRTLGERILGDIYAKLGIMNDDINNELNVEDEEQ